MILLKYIMTFLKYNMTFLKYNIILLKYNIIYLNIIRSFKKDLFLTCHSDCAPLTFIFAYIY